METVIIMREPQTSMSSETRVWFSVNQSEMPEGKIFRI